MNGNLRRQKNRRNELTSSLLQSSYVVLALVVSLIHRTDWRMTVAKKRVLIVPRGVEGHGLVVGSVLGIVALGIMLLYRLGRRSEACLGSNFSATRGGVSWIHCHKLVRDLFGKLSFEKK